MSQTNTRHKQPVLELFEHSAVFLKYRPSLCWHKHAETSYSLFMTRSRLTVSGLARQYSAILEAEAEMGEMGFTTCFLPESCYTRALHVKLSTMFKSALLH